MRQNNVDANAEISSDGEQISTEYDHFPVPGDPIPQPLDHAEIAAAVWLTRTVFPDAEYASGE